MVIRTLALILLAGMAHAQDTAPSVTEAAEARGIGGMGLTACRDLAGAENTPLLAQAGDWMLGYMAGRIDAGEMLVADEPLSAASSIDVVTSIATFCGANGEATVLAAARRYGQRVFGTEPLQRSFETAPAAVTRPESRPASIPVAAGTESQTGD